MLATSRQSCQSFWLEFILFSVIAFVLPTIIWLSWLRLRNHAERQRSQHDDKIPICGRNHIDTPDAWILLAAFLMAPLVDVAGAVYLVVVLVKRLLGKPSREEVAQESYILVEQEKAEPEEPEQPEQPKQQTVLCFVKNIDKPKDGK